MCEDLKDLDSFGWCTVVVLPCDAISERAALATDLPENWLQVVFAGPQVVHWSGASIHCWHAHGCRGRSVTGYTACHLEWRYIVPHTNSRFGHRTFSVVHLELGIGCRPADLKTALCSTEVFKHRLKTFLFNCVYCDWQHIVVPYCYAPSVYL